MHTLTPVLSLTSLLKFDLSVSSLIFRSIQRRFKTYGDNRDTIPKSIHRLNSHAGVCLFVFVCGHAKFCIFFGFISIYLWNFLARHLCWLNNVTLSIDGKNKLRLLVIVCWLPIGHKFKSNSINACWTSPLKVCSQGPFLPPCELSLAPISYVLSPCRPDYLPLGLRGCA